MRKINFENHFTVDRDSSEPVYQQLVEAVLYATKTGIMSRGDRLPSINELSRHYAVSRSTIEKSYNNLRDMGILASQHGKSYYISRLDPAPELKVLVLFNQLDAYNKEIFDALAESLGHRAEIDFQVYYDSAAHLKQLLRKKQESSSHIAIIPHFLDDEDAGILAIERLPKSKLIVLDKPLPNLSGDSGMICENFGQDIAGTLKELAPQLRKYQCINLINPDHCYFSGELRERFASFCKQQNLVFRVATDITGEMVRDGEAFIVLCDEQLMQLIRKINQRNLVPGKQVGIISYRDNDAKKAMLNGITTISSDRREMGRMAARMILTGIRKHIYSPFAVTSRRSL